MGWQEKWMREFKESQSIESEICLDQNIIGDEVELSDNEMNEIYKNCDFNWNYSTMLG